MRWRHAGGRAGAAGARRPRRQVANARFSSVAALQKAKSRVAAYAALQSSPQAGGRREGAAIESAQRRLSVPSLPLRVCNARREDRWISDREFIARGKEEEKRCPSQRLTASYRSMVRRTQQEVGASLPPQACRQRGRGCRRERWQEQIERRGAAAPVGLRVLCSYEQRSAGMRREERSSNTRLPAPVTASHRARRTPASLTPRRRLLHR
jgi:hypothetical protein